jgi:hypothetical protein
VSSKPYLEIQNFNQRLRLKKEKYPSNKNDRHAPATCKTEDGLNRSRNEVEVETEVEVEGNRTHEEYSPIKKSDLKPYEKQTTEKKVAEFKLWTIESELWVEQSCMALRTDKEKLIAFCTDWINKAVIQKKFESYQNRNLISFMVKDFTPEKSSSSGEKQSKFSQAIESHKEAEKLLGIH